MLRVAEVAVFVTSPGSPEYWLPIGAKLSMGELQIPERKVMPRQEDMNLKIVCRFESWCWQRVTIQKVNLYNQLVVHFVRFISVRSIFINCLLVCFCDSL